MSNRASNYENRGIGGDSRLAEIPQEVVPFGAGARLIGGAYPRLPLGAGEAMADAIGGIKLAPQGDHSTRYMLYQIRSTAQGKSGILVDVHSISSRK